MVKPEAESAKKCEVADGVGRKSTYKGGGRETESNDTVILTLDTSPVAWAGMRRVP